MDEMLSTDGMEIVYEKPETLTDTYLHYCPGCGHGVVHKLLMEVVKKDGGIEKGASALSIKKVE